MGKDSAPVTFRVASPPKPAPQPLPPVGRWVALLVLAIAATVIVAMFIAWHVWPDAADEAPNAKRDLEVLKTCLQVVGVGAFGAIVAATAATVESVRQR